jgi:hypothetical protein
LNIDKLFEDAYIGVAQHGGIANLTTYARSPKHSASVRVTRHFMKHQRQLENAKKSGIGERETARRRKQNVS